MSLETAHRVPNLTHSAQLLPPPESSPRVDTLAPLWAEGTATLGLARPTQYTLPTSIGIVDLAVEPNGRVWLLGEFATVYRIDAGSIVLDTGMACVEPRPKDLPPDELWPSNMQVVSGHALAIGKNGVELILSRPGGSSSDLFKARRMASGKVQCDLPPFVMSGACWGELYSGGSHWTMSYGGLQPVLGAEAREVPSRYSLCWNAALVPFDMAGAAPIARLADGSFLRFNGVRWETIAPPVHPMIPWIDPASIKIDEAGILWGLAGSGTQKPDSVVHFDGAVWRQGRVAGVSALRFVFPFGKNAQWIVGSDQVVYHREGRRFASQFQLQLLRGSKVDAKGGLWLWGALREPNAEAVESDTLYHFAPPKESE